MPECPSHLLSRPEAPYILERNHTTKSDLHRPCYWKQVSFDLSSPFLNWTMPHWAEQLSRCYISVPSLSRSIGGSWRTLDQVISLNILPLTHGHSQCHLWLASSEQDASLWAWFGQWGQMVHCSCYLPKLAAFFVKLSNMAPSVLLKPFLEIPFCTL